MIRAYSELYLKDARCALANSLDYAVHTLGYAPEEYYTMFIKSDLSAKFEKGDPYIVSGRSGVELALMVIEKNTVRYEYKERIYHDGKSREYWAGWTLAYYQWYTACSFFVLEKSVPIVTVLSMYDKYHEMDIMQFVDRISEMRQKNRANTYLKKIRESRGFSQRELSMLTGIPLKTLQHYEQGTKPLEKANVSYVLTLSKTLSCPMEELLQ